MPLPHWFDVRIGKHRAKVPGTNRRQIPTVPAPFPAHVSDIADDNLYPVDEKSAAQLTLAIPVISCTGVTKCQRIAVVVAADCADR